MSAQLLDEEAIFKIACQIDSPQGRADYLRQVCGSDGTLHDRVALLLQEHREHPSFLESPPEAFAPTIDMPAEAPLAEKIGTVIGSYKLLQQIGEGGMGVVYMAEQAAPIRRKVALKIIKPGMDTREVIARFEAERQALALMDHPNIARVFDGGATEAGRPYFVMELVRGVPITDYCDQNSLPVHERLELFIAVCQAVQHAHQKGIIHRDIKPSNVLVTLHDSRPVPKVIDFGVAKAIGQQLTDMTLFTQFAQMVGTPLYMSPEQAQLSGQDVDTRGDIYSLGVLLYELLTGTTPFERARLKTVALDEIRRMIREEDPPSPSRRLSSTAGETQTVVAAHRRLDPRGLSRLVRGDLDWIVMKALEKDRNRRYATANAFALDIQRYLADEPVAACPPSAGYRFRKFARRNRTALTMASCVLAALVTVAASIIWIVRDGAARKAAIDGEMNRAHFEAAALIDAAKWPEALAIVQRAEKLFLAAGHRQLPQPLQGLKDDLAMAERLENIFSRPVTEEFFTGHEPDSAYAEAFADAGIDVARLPVTAAAQRIRARRIWREFARALDIWASMRQRAGNKNAPGWKQLLEIAEATDPDPWRNTLRRARRQSDSKKLTELAATVEIARLQPESLHLLGSALHDSGAKQEALALLRQAQVQYPEDWWINNLLGWYCLIAVPPNYDDALRYYTASLAVRPRNSRTLHAIGRALHGKQATAEAVVVFSRGIEISPKDLELWSRRGFAYSDLGQFDKALADYSTAIELDPKNAILWFNRGCVYGLQGLNDKALADYSTAIELDAKHAATFYNRSLIYEQQGLTEQARADYSKVIELNPKSALGYLNRGTVYVRQRLDDKALADYSAAIELDPTSALARYNRGTIYGRQSLFDKALADYTASIKLDPKYALAWYNRGRIYAAQWVNDKALSDFATAIELDPKHPSAWANRGAMHGRQGAHEQAIADLSTAIELDPKGAVTWYLRGASHMALNRVHEALADFSKAVDQAPDRADIRQRRGQALARLDRWEDAIAEFKKVVELAPQAASGINELAWYLANCIEPQHRDPARAVELARKASELEPTVSTYLNTLGIANYRAGDWNAALTELKKSMQLRQGGDGFDWFFLAMSHWQLGNRDEARKWSARAVEWMEKNHPENEELKRFRAEAEELFRNDDGLSH